MTRAGRHAPICDEEGRVRACSTVSYSARSRYNVQAYSVGSARRDSAHFRLRSWCFHTYARRAACRSRAWHRACRCVDIHCESGPISSRASQADQHSRGRQAAAQEEHVVRDAQIACPRRGRQPKNSALRAGRLESGRARRRCCRERGSRPTGVLLLSSHRGDSGLRR
jgi:hypothetical protein